MEKLSGLQKEFQKIKPSINKHNWRGINYPTTIDDWKIFEKNNPTVALNVLYTKKICPVYISTHNSTREKHNSLNDFK